jgi:hypothetical protein
MGSGASCRGLDLLRLRLDRRRLCLLLQLCLRLRLALHLCRLTLFGFGAGAFRFRLCLLAAPEPDPGMQGAVLQLELAPEGERLLGTLLMVQFAYPLFCEGFGCGLLVFIRPSPVLPRSGGSRCSIVAKQYWGIIPEVLCNPLNVLGKRHLSWIETPAGACALIFAGGRHPGAENSAK